MDVITITVPEEASIYMTAGEIAAMEAYYRKLYSNGAIPTMPSLPVEKAKPATPAEPTKPATPAEPAKEVPTSVLDLNIEDVRAWAKENNLPSERITLKTKKLYLASLQEDSHPADEDDDLDGGLLGGDDDEGDDVSSVLGAEDDDDIASIFDEGEDENEPAEITEADVRAAAEALLKRKGGSALRGLLDNTFKAKRLSGVPEERWAEFVKVAGEL